jgi:hypothetical protein
VERFKLTPFPRLEQVPAGKSVQVDPEMSSELIGVAHRRDPIAVAGDDDHRVLLHLRGPGERAHHPVCPLQEGVLLARRILDLDQRLLDEDEIEVHRGEGPLSPLLFHAAEQTRFAVFDHESSKLEVGEVSCTQ